MVPLVSTTKIVANVDGSAVRFKLSPYVYLKS